MSEKILVVDDDEMVGKSFSLALEDLPYQVDTIEFSFRKEYFDELKDAIEDVIKFEIIAENSR